MTVAITQDTILQKMDIMQKECPEMFATPGANKNEICLGYHSIDFLAVNLSSLRSAGLLSVRTDKNYPEEGFIECVQTNDKGKRIKEKIKTTSYPIFADAEEYIRLELSTKD
jgi:hypothetical protein